MMRAVLRFSSQLSSRRRQHRRIGNRQLNIGLVGVEPVLGVDRVADWHGRVTRPEAELEHSLLVLRVVDDEVAERGSGLTRGVGDPGSVEDVGRVVGIERSLRRVDRDQRNPRNGTGRTGVGRVAPVVGDDRHLFDRDGRGIGEPATLLIGAVHVVEEGQGGVAVVDGCGFDPTDELEHIGIGEIVGRQTPRSCRWRRNRWRQ